MRFWRWPERRAARKYRRDTGQDRPLRERAAELKRLSVGAPVIIHVAPRADGDPNRMARHYLDRLREMNPSPHLLAAIEAAEADLEEGLA